MAHKAEKLQKLRKWYENALSQHLRKNEAEKWDQLIKRLSEIISAEDIGNPAGVMPIALRYLDELERRAE